MGLGRRSAQVARSGKASLERYPWSRDLTDGKPALRRPEEPCSRKETLVPGWYV